TVGTRGTRGGAATASDRAAQGRPVPPPERHPEIPPLPRQATAERARVASGSDAAAPTPAADPAAMDPAAGPRPGALALARTSQPTPESTPESTPGSVSDPAPGPAAGLDAGLDSVALTAAVVQIIADQTGYPPEMVEPDCDLEADLSIDSIKRTEILGALAER